MFGKESEPIGLKGLLKLKERGDRSIEMAARNLATETRYEWKGVWTNTAPSTDSIRIYSGEDT